MEQETHPWRGGREPSSLGQQIVDFPARGDRANLPGIAPSAPVLPVQPTPLIGREREVAEVVALLRGPEARMVTLTGPGGVGKTRLALAVGDALRDDFREGVWWVDLADVRDPALVPARVAVALGFPSSSGLRDGLRGWTALLLLDNCEQVRAMATALADLLAACPGVRILATSRMPLRFRWEREKAVPPLPIADPALAHPPEALATVPAVALFLDRLAAIHRDFALDAASAPIVAAICHRLGGLPLAIELAATLSRSLPLPALLARLSDRSPLDVLTNGPLDLPVRQRTLRDTLDWSYELLDDEARRALRRCGIFDGGWDDEAARAVAGGDPGWALVEASLAHRAPDPTGRERYALPSAVRAYALDRLRDAGEADAVAERHALHYLALAERAAAGLSGPEQATWLARLDIERDNVDGALAWSLRHRAVVALRLLSALGHYRFRRGIAPWPGALPEMVLELATDVEPRQRAAILRDAVRWALREGDAARGAALAEQADRFGESDDPASAAELAVTRAFAALARDDYAEALRRFEACARLYLCAGDRASAARQYLAAGNVAWRQGDRETTARCWERALALGSEAGDAYAVAGARVNLASLAFVLGDRARAEELARRADDWYAASGDLVGTAKSQQILGLLVAAGGDLDRADRLLRSNLQHWLRLGSVRRIAIALQLLAAVAARGGQYDRATRLFAAADGRWARLDQSPPPLLWAHLERDLDAVREQLSAATFRRAWAAGRELTDAEALDEALGGAAIVVPVPLGGVPRAAAHERAPQRLTDRQRAVASLVVLGLTNREIAHRLSISERTVDAHIQDILERLGFNSRAQIAGWVAQNGREQHSPDSMAAARSIRELPGQDGARL